MGDSQDKKRPEPTFGKVEVTARQVASEQKQEVTVEQQLTALRALAVTVRTAQRNGHPDAAVHLNNLLNMLGAK